MKTDGGIMNRYCRMGKGRSLLGAALLLSGSLLQAEEISLKASTKRENALYSSGEPIVFNVSVQEKSGKMVAGRKIDYLIEGDGGLKKSGSLTSADLPVEITAKLDRPGFVRLTVSTDEGGRKQKTWAGAGVDVLKIRAATPETPDFDAFWEKQLKELRSRRYRTTLRQISDPGIMKGVAVYDTKLEDGALGAGGFLILPPNPAKGAHPLVVTFNGASKIGAFYRSFDRMAASYRAIVFNMNLHDTINQPTAAQVKKLRQSPEISNYMYRDANDAATYRIRNIFLRVARCLDYLKTRPEWDGKTIIVRGGSLGGAQALAAAYFEPLTVLCVANAPALSDHYGAERRQAAGWPGLFKYLSGRDAQELAAAKKTMRYFDSVNFARRLKCPVTMSVGFIDPVCPPTTAYAVYNSLPMKEKSIKNVVLGLHGVSLKKGEKSVFSHGGSLVQQACRKSGQGK